MPRCAETGRFLPRDVPEGMKWCPVCETLKPLSDFHCSKNRHDGRQSHCRTCQAERALRQRLDDPERYAANRRRAQIKKNWGLTVEAYDALVAQPCEICRTTERVRVVDHDHTSGEIRGPLCHPCNRAIGLLGDDAARLQAAADYVDRGGPSPGG